MGVFESKALHFCRGGGGWLFFNTVGGCLSSNNFRDILKFKIPKYAKGHNSGKFLQNLFKIYSDNLLIIPYQLTEFQASHSNIYRDILQRIPN